MRFMSMSYPEGAMFLVIAIGPVASASNSELECHQEQMAQGALRCGGALLTDTVYRYVWQRLNRATALEPREGCVSCFFRECHMSWRRVELFASIILLARLRAAGGCAGGAAALAVP
jgi:hypothetical protein